MVSTIMLYLATQTLAGGYIRRLTAKSTVGCGMIPLFLFSPPSIMLCWTEWRCEDN